MNDRLKPVLPNLVTFASSLFALVAIFFAYRLQTRDFAYFLLLSGLMDALDGPLARKLKAESPFGNIYDSMSDFLAFGIAPAACLWFLGYLHPWAAAVYALCIQFRLTRFSSKPPSSVPETFFQGISAPDSVYVATLLGLVLRNFDIGFTIAACSAVYPGKLMPKKYKAVRLLVAAAVMIWFIRFG